MISDAILLAATQAIHDVDCDEGPECPEVLSVDGRYGRYAAAALAAALGKAQSAFEAKAFSAIITGDDDVRHREAVELMAAALRDLGFGPSIDRMQNAGVLDVPESFACGECPYVGDF